MSAQSSPEGPLPAKDSQLLFAAGESPTVEAGMQARRAALLNLNESYDGLGDAMATDPTEIPVDFLRAQPLLAVQMAALVVAPGRMQEVVRVASSRTKEFPTAADAIDELIRIMQEEVIEQLLELQEAGQQAAAQERSSGKTGAQRLSSVEKGPVACHQRACEWLSHARQPTVVLSPQLGQLPFRGALEASWQGLGAPGLGWF